MVKKNIFIYLLHTFITVKLTMSCQGLDISTPRSLPYDQARFRFSTLEQSRSDGRCWGSSVSWQAIHKRVPISAQCKIRRRRTRPYDHLSGRSIHVSTIYLLFILSLSNLHLRFSVAHMTLNIDASEFRTFPARRQPTASWKHR